MAMIPLSRRHGEEPIPHTSTLAERAAVVVVIHDKASAVLIGELGMVTRGIHVRSDLAAVNQWMP